MGGLCRERGVPFVVVIFPLFGNPLDERYPFAEIHAKVAQAAAEAGAKVVDLLPRYRRLDWRLLVVDGAADEHPNEIAHRIAAQAIVRGDGRRGAAAIGARTRRPMSRSWPWGLVGALVALQAGLAVHAMRGNSATFDEGAHLPAGYTHLALGDHRLNPEQPPLVKLLAAAPLLLVGPELSTRRRLLDAVPPVGVRPALPLPLERRRPAAVPGAACRW